MNNQGQDMLYKLCIVPLSEESLGGGKGVGVQQKKKRSALQMNMDIPECAGRENKWG